MATVEDELSMPGDKIFIDYKINNQSENDYQYKDGSFELKTLDLTDEDYLTGFYAQDGNNLPISMIAGIPVNDFIKELLDTDGKNPTIEQILSLYDQLEEKGYTDDNALTQYFLDKVEEETGIRYDHISEFYTDNFRLFDQLNVGKNGLYPISEDELNRLCMNATPNQKRILDIANYDGKNLRPKWPEEELATASYDAFYDCLMAISFGEDIDPTYQTEEGREQFFYVRSL